MHSGIPRRTSYTRHRVLYVNLLNGTCEEILARSETIDYLKRIDYIQILSITRRK